MTSPSTAFIALVAAARGAALPQDRSEHRRPKKNSPAKRAPVRSSSAIRVRQVGHREFELLHPRCALERADDLDETRNMVAAGEIEIATDELRWLLSGCHDFIDAHRMLGELALAEDDLSLARGHFGIAYQLGYKAVGDLKGMLPYRLPGNQSFYESGKGLVWCLWKLNKPELAREVADTLLRLDPTDTLGMKRLVAELAAGQSACGATDDADSPPDDR
jgi:hypothetical protein